MEELSTQTQIFTEALSTFGGKIMSALPSILAALFVLLIGWLIAVVIGLTVAKVAEKLQINRLSKRVGLTDFLAKAKVESTPAKLLGRIFKWIVLLIVGLITADTLGWNSFSAEISKLLAYLPKLFLAVIFFLVGTYIARFVRDFIRAATSSLGIATGRIASNFVYYLLVIIVSLTALEQAGLDTSIITSNLLVILGTIFLSAAISYGFASRDLLSNILASYYSRRTFSVGQIIDVDGEKGEIIATTNINVTLQKEDGEKVVIPTQMLINRKVKVS